MHNARAHLQAKTKVNSLSWKIGFIQKVDEFDSGWIQVAWT